MIDIDFQTSYCPCGSGQLLKDCCLIYRLETRLGGQQTGFSHPRCFASELKDCSKKISREHYISRNLLNMFGKSSLEAEGLPWIPKNGIKELSVDSLTGKILCQRHNTALSPLDGLAKTFFNFFLMHNEAAKSELLIINGYEIERWFLKTLCGLVASGNTTFNGKIVKNWKPKLEWLKVLFDEGQVEPGSGLIFISGKFQSKFNQIGSQVVYNTTGQPTALVFHIAGFAFLFTLGPLPDADPSSASRAILDYRPKAIQLRFTNYIRVAHLGWLDGPFVSVNVKTS